MAPRGRREPSAGEHLFKLGERGRKTGVFLNDTGARDEHGMQPLDDIFSSPQKENGEHGQGDEDEDEDGSDDGVEMDIDNVTAPDPVSFMKNRRSIPMPLPRARSPPKTNLQSPAVKSAHLGRSSSPERGSIVAPRERSPSRFVKRKLDFSMNLKKPAVNGTSAAGGVTRGAASSDGAVEGEDEDEDEETILHGRGDDSVPPIAGDESMAVVDAGGYDDDVEDEEPTAEPEQGPGEEPEEEEEEEEPSPKPAPARRRGRPKKAPAEAEAAEDSVVDAADEAPHRGKKRGRPAKAKEAQETAGTESTPKRRRSDRGSGEAEEAEEAEAAEKTKRRGRPKAADSAKAEPPQASKPRVPAQKGRKRTPAAAGDTSLAEIPRGPPLPRGRGLTILRRETPSDSEGMIRTRSGRNSYKPLAFWKNEHTELQEDITEDAFSHGKSHFVLPTIKEVVRVEEPEEERKRPGARRGAKSSAARRGRPRRAHDDDEDEDEDGAEVEREEWEADPGVVRGEVLVWQPEHEFSPPGSGDEDQIEVAEDQLAIAAPALKTQAVHNATFGFTKTLSMPFFGSGVVDLPPGAEKRPKNSRKMHMTFFVYSGRVKVTVGATTFRIARGGMWFVPRGNYYSIENDSYQPSRVFFAQGCEVVVDASS